MNNTAKIAVLIFYAGFLGVIVGGCFASLSAPDISSSLKWTLNLSTAGLLVGALMCWRSGWKRYKEESAGGSLQGFLVYVWLAPFSLPFSIR